MLFIFAGVVLGVFIAWSAVLPIYSGGDVFEGIFLSVLLGLIGLLVGAGVSAFIGIFPSKHLEETDRHELVALKDTIGVQGSFFLGTGTINNELSYFYYRKEGSAYKAEKADDSSLIFEDTETSPYVLVKQDTFNHPTWFAFAIPLHEQTEFHVPKGSVLKGYTLDLK